MYDETVQRMWTLVADKVATMLGSSPVPLDMGHAHAEN